MYVFHFQKKMNIDRKNITTEKVTWKCKCKLEYFFTAFLYVLFYYAWNIWIYRQSWALFTWNIQFD